MSKYIGDIGNPISGPGAVAGVTFSMVLFALAVGFVVGLVVWAVFWASSFLTNLLWVDAKAALEGALAGAGLQFWWLPILFCTAGGLFIGLFTKFTGASPEPLDKVMGQVKETGEYNLEKPAASVVAFLLPLVFGGSVGPEAGLTGIIAAACTKIGRALKGAGVRVKNVADITVSAALCAVFAAPFAGVVACAENSGIKKSAPADGVNPTPTMPADGVNPTTPMPADGANPTPTMPADGVNPTPEDLSQYEFKRSGKLVLYTASALGALAGIMVFSGIFGRGCGLPRFTGAPAGATELAWALPCLIVGYLGAVLFHTSNFCFSRASEKLQRFVVLKPLLAGVALGVVAVAFPFVLFPGEEQAFELMEGWQDIAGAALIATGLLKCIATPMCLNFGWRGGNFFPCIFAGIAAGYGVAAVSGAQPMFCVCVTCAMLVAGIQRKPLMALALLLLCFPVDCLAQMGIACLIGAYAPQPFKLSRP